MRIRQFILAILVGGGTTLLSGLFVPIAQGYGTNTHAFLTQTTINFYNRQFPRNAIKDEYVNYFIDGSRDEDNTPRYMNHFYDPVNNRGLTDGLLRGEKSKDWAQNENSQTAFTLRFYPRTEKSTLTASEIDVIRPIYNKTNFTWQRALDLYAQGKNEEAFFALGHIVHLIQDASVPEHTRNDPHPPTDNGGSPYENWTSRFSISNPDNELAKRLDGRSTYVLSDLDRYFDAMATYTNNNFYSRDSIENYSLPKVQEVIKSDNLFYGLAHDDIGTYKLIADVDSIDWKRRKVKPTIAINSVLSDYWSHLSTKAVQYGAGVIDLFIRQGEAQKARLEREKSSRPVLGLLTAGIDSIFGSNTIEVSVDQYKHGTTNNSVVATTTPTHTPTPASTATHSPNPVATATPTPPLPTPTPQNYSNILENTRIVSATINPTPDTQLTPTTTPYTVSYSYSGGGTARHDPESVPEPIETHTETTSENLTTEDRSTTATPEPTPLPQPETMAGEIEPTPTPGPTPTSTPTPHTLNVVYDRNTLELSFTWDQIPSASYTLTDITNTSMPEIITKTASSSFKKTINRVGKIYTFELTASPSAETLHASINVPSFLDAAVYTVDAGKYSLALRWSQYPIAPIHLNHLASHTPANHNWQVIVFYKNTPAKTTATFMWDDWSGRNQSTSYWGIFADNGLKVNYPNCRGSSAGSTGSALILPETAGDCSSLATNQGGSSYNFSEIGGPPPASGGVTLKVLTTNFPSPPVVGQEYLTVALYAYQPGYEPNNSAASLLAVDETKYYLESTTVPTPTPTPEPTPEPTPSPTPTPIESPV